MDPILGQIMLFAGGFAPRGWAICNGQLLPIAQNQALFSILGTTYGGDGRTTFALPDFRGRLPVHPGAGVNLGDRGGEAANTLTVAQTPAHIHPVASTKMACSSTASTTVAAGDYPGFAPGSFKPYAAANAGAAVYAGDLEATAAPAGSGAPLNNLMPSLCVNYLIALTGVYPSRS